MNINRKNSDFAISIVIVYMSALVQNMPDNLVD